MHEDSNFGGGFISNSYPNGVIKGLHLFEKLKFKIEQLSVGIIPESKPNCCLR